MENKSTIDILKEIRDSRNLYLVKNKDNSVFYTKVMALEKGAHTQKQIYRIIEEYYVAENQSNIRELFYEYENNEPRLIAMLDNSFDTILPTQDFVKDEKSQEEWNILYKDIEESIAKSKENTINEALNLGISNKEIEGLSELDIDKKIFTKIKEFNEQNDIKEQEKEESEKTISIPQDEAKKFGIIGINTIPLNQRVGVHGETLKTELELNKDPKYADVDEIEWVPSYKTQEFGINVPDVPLVPLAKHKDGSLETFPESICKPYKGENNEIIEIDGEQDKVTKGRTNCMFEFTNGKALTAKQGDLGRCESSLAYNTTNNDGRVSLTTQDKYDGTEQADIEARQIVDSYQGKTQYDKIRDEANNHPQSEQIQREDADGIGETGHHHLNQNIELTPDTVLIYEGKEMKLSEIAADSRFKLSPEEFIEKYNRISDGQNNLSEEQIYEEIEEEANEEVRAQNQIK